MALWLPTRVQQVSIQSHRECYRERGVADFADTHSTEPPANKEPPAGKFVWAPESRRTALDSHFDPPQKTTHRT